MSEKAEPAAATAKAKETSGLVKALIFVGAFVVGYFVLPPLFKKIVNELQSRRAQGALHGGAGQRKDNAAAPASAPVADKA
jgi:hypothetical protein